MVARPRKWVAPVILVFLKEESSSYGYEIMERLEEEFGFEQISPGSVYRALRQMDKEGLCTSKWEINSSEDGRQTACTLSLRRGKNFWRPGSSRVSSTEGLWTRSHESIGGVERPTLPPSSLCSAATTTPARPKPQKTYLAPQAAAWLGGGKAFP